MFDLFQKAKKYIIYVRKSEDDATKQVRSIADQIDECNELKRRYDLNVVDTVVEERSARRSSNRQKFSDILSRIKKKEIDGLITWSPDRLSRNMKEAGEIIDLLDEGYLIDIRFAAYYFANDYNGKMNLGMQFVLAKQYTDKLSVDVIRGQHKSLEEGRSGGQYKAGYVRSEMTGYYEPDETVCGKSLNNFQLIRKAWEMRIYEEKHLNEIKEYLNLNGYNRKVKRNTAKKLTMTTQKLSKIFGDPVYYGRLRQGDKMVNLTDLYEFTPMITEAEFLLGKRLIHHDLKAPRKHMFPFKGLLLCDQCKRPLTAGSPKSHNGTRYLRYWCQNKNCEQGNISIRAKDVLDFMVNILQSFDQIEPKRDYKKYTDAAKANIMQDKLYLAKEHGSLTRRKHQLELEFEDLIIILSKKRDEKEKQVLVKRKTKVRSELEKIEIRLSQISTEIDKLKPINMESFLNHLKTMAESLLAASPDAKDEIAKNVFLNLTARDGKIASAKLKEVFALMLKLPDILNGGR